jgi:hypothetical protein
VSTDVPARSKPDAMRRLPPRIALVGLDDELGTYLADWLARHWPQARVRRLDDGVRVVADLAIVDREPEGPSSVPTLWLAEIDRSRVVMRIGPRLWRTAMPTTALRLRRVIEACLDTLGA